MANPERIDPFISTEEEAEVDAETAAAIQRGIEDADAGRVITLEEARERMYLWLSKSSSPTQLLCLARRTEALENTLGRLSLSE